MSECSFTLHFVVLVVAFVLCFSLGGEVGGGGGGGYVATDDTHAPIPSLATKKKKKS